MTDADRIAAYWESAERRDWETFGSLLADEVVYRMPQTGETISGKGPYLRFNIDYPAGDWQITVERILVDGSQATSWITMTVDGEALSAITFFVLGPSGLIRDIVDFWPQPYAAPDRGGDHVAD